jgi:hypothetical protein
LKRRVVGGAASKEDGSNTQSTETGESGKDNAQNKHEKEQNADLGKVVNLMQ